MNRQEHCDRPARPSFALPRLHRLLYRRRPQQIRRTGKVPGYRTLPATQPGPDMNAFSVTRLFGMNETFTYLWVVTTSAGGVAGAAARPGTAGGPGVRGRTACVIIW